MTLDDESILSAYLDGQLGPEEQQVVEAAVLDDPRLAEDLRSLAAAPRPGRCQRACPEVPADVTARVMRRVRRRALLGPAAGIIAWAPFRAAGLAAIAASVLLAVALTWFLRVAPGPAVGVGDLTAVVQKGPIDEGGSAGRSPSWYPVLASDFKPPPAARRPARTATGAEEAGAPLGRQMDSAAGDGSDPRASSATYASTWITRSSAASSWSPNGKTVRPSSGWPASSSRPRGSNSTGTPCRRGS